MATLSTPEYGATRTMPGGPAEWDRCRSWSGGTPKGYVQDRGLHPQFHCPGLRTLSIGRSARDHPASCLDPCGHLLVPVSGIVYGPVAIAVWGLVTVVQAWRRPHWLREALIARAKAFHGCRELPKSLS